MCNYKIGKTCDSYIEYLGKKKTPCSNHGFYYSQYKENSKVESTYDINNIFVSLKLYGVFGNIFKKCLKKIIFENSFQKQFSIFFLEKKLSQFILCFYSNIL